MTLEDDHWSAMTHLSPHIRSSRDRDLDALGDGDSAVSQDLQEVEVFLSQLRGLVDRPAPTPSAQLASVLAHGFAPRVPATPTTRESPGPALSSWLRRGALAFGLSAGLSASLVGAAAASGQLPDGAREVVDRIVEAVTPFSVQDAQEPLPTVDDSPAPEPPPVPDEARHDTRTVPTYGDDTPAGDGVKGRGSGENSGPRAGHDRDSATEADVEPPESAGRGDRSGSSGADGDDDDDADHVDDADDGDGAEHTEDGDGEESQDGEESGAEQDLDD